jgi:hypothetical protein
MSETSGERWVFSFGGGQTLKIADSAGNIGGTGVDASAFYVVVTGSWASARALMFRLFGWAWCDQYEYSYGLENAARYGWTHLFDLVAELDQAVSKPPA